MVLSTRASLRAEWRLPFSERKHDGGLFIVRVAHGEAPQAGVAGKAAGCRLTLLRAQVPCVQLAHVGVFVHMFVVVATMVKAAFGVANACALRRPELYDKMLEFALSKSHPNERFFLRIQAANIKSGLMELRKVRTNMISGARSTQPKQLSHLGMMSASVFVNTRSGFVGVGIQGCDGERIALRCCRLPAWLTAVANQIVLTETDALSVAPPNTAGEDTPRSAPTPRALPPTDAATTGPPPTARRLLRAQASCPSSDLATTATCDSPAKPVESPDKTPMPGQTSSSAAGSKDDAPPPAPKESKFWDRRFCRGAKINERGQTILCDNMEEPKRHTVLQCHCSGFVASSFGPV